MIYYPDVRPRVVTESDGRSSMQLDGALATLHGLGFEEFRVLNLQLCAQLGMGLKPFHVRRVLFRSPSFRTSRRMTGIRGGCEALITVQRQKDLARLRF